MTDDQKQKIKEHKKKYHEAKKIKTKNKQNVSSYFK